MVLNYCGKKMQFFHIIKKRGTMSSYSRKNHAAEGEDSLGTYTMARLSKKLSTTRRSYWRS